MGLLSFILLSLILFSLDELIISSLTSFNSEKGFEKILFEILIIGLNLLFKLIYNH